MQKRIKQLTKYKSGQQLVRNNFYNPNNKNYYENTPPYIKRVVTSAYKNHEWAYIRLYPKIIVYPNGCKSFTLKRLINENKTVTINNSTNASFEMDNNDNYIITPINNDSDVIIDFGTTAAGTLGNASFDFTGEIISYIKQSINFKLIWEPQSKQKEQF